MGTSMASPHKSLQIWVKSFSPYLLLENFSWPKFWREYLHSYLLSFLRFWTLSIEWFWLLFWFILNGVTLNTSNWAKNSCKVLIWTVSCMLNRGLLGPRKALSMVWDNEPHKQSQALLLQLQSRWLQNKLPLLLQRFLNPFKRCQECLLTNLGF